MAKKENPKFEHRHYELLAKILGAVKSAKLTYKIKGDLRADGYYHAVNHIENVLITCFENDNVNFNCDRFLKTMEWYPLGAFLLELFQVNHIVNHQKMVVPCSELIVMIESFGKNFKQYLYFFMITKLA